MKLYNKTLRKRLITNVSYLALTSFWQGKRHRPGYFSTSKLYQKREIASDAVRLAYWVRTYITQNKTLSQPVFRPKKTN